MRTYDEDRHFEERAIDLDSGEELNAPKKGVGEKQKELLRWSEELRGTKFISKVKQFAAMKKAKQAGIEIGELKERWLQMEADPFWRKTGFDWMSVLSSFDKKR